MNEEKRVWGIHTLDDSLFLKGELIAIGWKEMGDLSVINNTREVFKSKYAEVYPDAKKGSIATSAGMLYRFCHEAQVGDYVVFPSKADRNIYIGVIEGVYQHDENAYEYVNQRKVKWLAHVPRMSFSQGALYEVGSALTFFMIKSYAEEFLRALDKGFKKSVLAEKGDDETVAATAEGIMENTKDFILKELSRQMKGYDMEDFVADLLNAMGYRTSVSLKGGDRGIDIFAYKDELPPRIAVQVKSQDGDIKETILHSLKGAMKEGDYGLFITLSDFSPNARKYLNENPIIRGINGVELVDLILEYYEKLSPKHKMVIPLKKVYIPVSTDGGAYQ